MVRNTSLLLSKEVLRTIFKVFGMTRPGIEPRSPGPLANTLPTRPMSWSFRDFFEFFDKISKT